MQNEREYVAGLYCRLSKDDDQRGESTSIGTQRSILTEYCNAKGYAVYKVYVDDGYSGLNFQRPSFQELLEDVEKGNINMVITKDLSRLGRDYIMTGYYSEIYFQSKDVRYIAIADNFDSLYGNNDIAPFKNILNDMYARDISQKIKNAKRQRAKQGFVVGAQTPYGYKKNEDNHCRMMIDDEAAETVRTIFSLALRGLGNVAIARELEYRCIPTPSVYKFRQGDSRYGRFSAVQKGTPYAWCAQTVGKILTDRVYIGELTSLKTETVNYKTRQRVPVPLDRRIITKNAHDAIIEPELFDLVQEIRSTHKCPARAKRYNLFRGLLFCECCGHPLTISRKQLLYREADIYFCMNHYHNPSECPKTHRVYHEMLYPYVLQQIQDFAKSMKKRKVKSAIKDFADIKELSPEILQMVIERIEISHVTKKTKPGKAIQIYWKLQ